MVIQLLCQMDDFRICIKDRYLGYFLWNCPQLNYATRHQWWLVGLVSGNGLVLSSNKPSPEPMLTHTFVVIWHDQTTKSWIIKRTHWLFWMMWFGYQNVIWNCDRQRNLDVNMSNFVVSHVPADGLAPCVARTSAGTVMTKFNLIYIYVYISLYLYIHDQDWHFEELKLKNIVLLISIVLLVRPW